MHKCAEAWLVSLEHELPADPAVFYAGEEPIVGCNHLVCGQCGAEVHHIDGRSAASNYPPSDTDVQALYDSNDPSSPLLERGPMSTTARTYFCRCDLVGVDSSARWLEVIDQPWTCAGHEAARPNPEADLIAAARKATDALIAAAGLPSEPAKIRFSYAVNVRPSFATASELRDSLLASYPDVGYFGRPVAGRNRDDIVPAWGWALDLIATRTDWWPALGIAIQHAVKDGGDNARYAFVDLLGSFRESIALLPWSSPMAAEWPDAYAGGSAAGWGDTDSKLASIIRDQTSFVATMTADLSEAFLVGYGKGGKDLDVPLSSEADVRAALDKSARAGQFPDGNKGPWSWYGFQRVIRGETLPQTLLAVVSTFDTADDFNVRALLDWFYEERDLWRFAPLLERWVAHPPPWWNAPAETKPSGWRYNMRTAHWPGITNLGSVVSATLRRARLQLATPPIVDLPLLYGSSIS